MTNMKQVQKQVETRFVRLDAYVTNWMAKYGIVILRVGLGIVFLWFGALKFFPSLSPAQELAGRTIEAISFGVVKPSLSLPVLALWETVIGLGLITGFFPRIILALLFLQMIGTIMPLFLYPAETFTRFPYAPTLEGQYIIKNVVLVAAGVVIGATARGGAMIADPVVARAAKQREETRLHQLTDKAE